MYYINFENDVFIDENIDLSHLKDLVRIYLNRCDSYQIKILKEDDKSKKIVEDFAVYADEDGYEYIFQGIVDEDFKKIILKKNYRISTVVFFVTSSAFRRLRPSEASEVHLFLFRLRPLPWSRIYLQPMRHFEEQNE